MADASLTAQDKHPLPLRLTSAFHPLSAHRALANISISLPNLCLWPTCGEGMGRGGRFVVVASVQSMTSTLGIELDVVCVLDCVGSGDWGGESRDEKGSDDGVASKSRTWSRE